MNTLKLAVALVIFAVAAAVHGHGPVAPREVRTEDAPAAVRSSGPAEALTLTLMDRAQVHRGSGPSLKVATHARLLDAARERHALLSALAATDPALVLRVALPADARAALPTEVRDLVEESVDATGELEVLHVDHVDSAHDHYVHTLETASARYTLHFADGAPDASTGSVARVRGVRLGDAIVVAGRTDVAVDKAAVSGAKGPQRTLAILVTFSNAPSQPYTKGYVENLLFGTTSNFEHEASYQQTTVVGTVAGWYTIAATSGSCDFAAIATQARAAAQAAGHVIADYARLMYIFPSTSCSWWGLGTVGGSPSQAWIHTKWGLTNNVVAHELGHNLGLFHSHSLDCGANAIASSGCSVSEYGDVFDLMGNNVGGHYSAYQKERLGWLGDGASPPITTVPATVGTATFDIAPLEDALNGQSRALKIPRTSACGVATEWFYVEARRAKGFDNFLSGNWNVNSGVLVHRVLDGTPDGGYLLDMTPSTSGWSDAALVAGRSFTDPATGVKIASVSASSGGARVSVTFPPASCSRVAPAMTLAPGGTVWTPAGASVSYTVQAENRDGCGCAPTAFDVGAAVPSGWGATVTRTASVAPGAVAVASILVTPSQAASAAFYPLTITAKSVSAPGIVASAAATVAVQVSAPPPAPTPSPPAAGPLAVTVTTAPTYERNFKAPYTAAIVTTVTRGGTPIAGVAVSMQVRDPKGYVSTSTGTSGAGGTVSLPFTVRPDTYTGSYMVTSNATVGADTAKVTAWFKVK